MKQSRNPAEVHPPLAAYSHQVEVSVDERWLVVSGQVGMKPDGTLPADPIAQIEEALQNISRNLQAAGMGIEDLVKLTIFLVGEWDNQRRREVMGAWLKGHKPCMTLLYVAGLAEPRYQVEIEAWAAAPERM